MWTIIYRLRDNYGCTHTGRGHKNNASKQNGKNGTHKTNFGRDSTAMHAGRTKNKVSKSSQLILDWLELLPLSPIELANARVAIIRVYLPGAILPTKMRTDGSARSFSPPGCFPCIP